MAYTDDQLNINMQRMQLHNISELSEYNIPPPQRPQHRPSPKENLFSLTQRISNDDLRIAIQMELKKLVSEYDQFISVLQQRSDVLEQEYESLQMAEESSHRRYEKAVREMQFFKKKYDQMINKQQHNYDGRPRSPSVDSNNNANIPTSPPPSVSGSETSNPLYNNHYHFPPHSLPPPPPIPSSSIDSKSRHLSRSSSSSTTSSNASLPFNNAYDNTPLVPRLRQNSTVTTSANSVHSNGASSVHSNSSADKYAAIHGRKGSWHHPEPHISRSTTNATHHINNSVIQQRRVDPLAFGGSDSFWETISKNSDQNIEKLISNFLRRGGSPNTANQSSSYSKSVKYGYGLIHSVVALKAFASLDVLLTQGANPNVLTLSQLEEDKVTPCYLASSLGWFQGLEALVNAGADLTLAKGIKNKTVLHVAAENCHITLVEYIIANTPPIFHSQLDSMGANAVHYATLSGHTDLLSFLIQQCHLSVDQVDAKGETPLHWASRAGQLESASFLIERCGADFNAYVSKKSNTPYDLAKQGGHKRLVEYYKKIGALTTKKMEKKREEEAEKEVPVHLQSALSKNGLFGF